MRKQLLKSLLLAAVFVAVFNLTSCKKETTTETVETTEVETTEPDGQNVDTIAVETDTIVTQEP